MENRDHFTAPPPAFAAGSGDMTADRRFMMATQLAARGDHAAAAELMAEACALVPHWAPGHFRHGEVLMAAGQNEAAIAAFETCLACDPGDRLGALIKLALLGARAAPATLPPDYIAALFDDYAPRFDRHLTQALGYDVPRLLTAAVTAWRPQAAGLRILDLGCGTGLAGAVLRDAAAWLEGVDLSPRMVAEAAKKQIYDRLHAADMMAVMAGAESCSFDLLTAADVLVYTGALTPALTAAQRILRRDGAFVFSLQRADGAPAPGFVLGADHRYSYNADYIRDVAAQTGFIVAEITTATLRHDGGRAVAGYIVTLRPL